MPGRPIVNKDAITYIQNVENHGIDADTQWIINEGRFPVGCCVLDVGSGTGKLATQLGSDGDFHRIVFGIELSRELVVHSTKQSNLSNVHFIEGDFLAWNPPANGAPDTLVMSFYLHHCDDHLGNLRKAASLLPHGGRLYIFDRIADDQPALDEFRRFWKQEYRDAHEWDEELPNICCMADLIQGAASAELRFVRHAVCAHDRRPGTDSFRKTLVEFWCQETGRRFPAVALVSPAHQHYVREVIDELAAQGIRIDQRKQVAYTGELIQKLYEHCPWKDRLAGFVAEVCPNAVATALVLQGDATNPNLLHQLTRFKKITRGKWKSICGPENKGMRPMILPFHVAEPHECETLNQLLGIEG